MTRRRVLAYAELYELIAQLPRSAKDATRECLARGDGIAVYSQSIPEHPEVVHLAFASYGSKEAQIRKRKPPLRLQGHQLLGIYRHA